MYCGFRVIYTVEVCVELVGERVWQSGSLAVVTLSGRLGNVSNCLYSATPATSQQTARAAHKHRIVIRATTNQNEFRSQMSVSITIAQERVC